MYDIGLPVPALPWRSDLFAVKTATTGPLYGKADTTTCSCGCKLPHNFSVSKLLTEQTPYGPVRKVLWFRSMSDRQKWEAANG